MFDKIDGIHYEDEQAIDYLPVSRAPWRHFVRQRPKLKIAIVLGHHVKVPINIVIIGHVANHGAVQIAFVKR